MGSKSLQSHCGLLQEKSFNFLLSTAYPVSLLVLNSPLLYPCARTLSTARRDVWVCPADLPLHSGEAAPSSVAAEGAESTLDVYS